MIGKVLSGELPFEWTGLLLNNLFVWMDDLQFFLLINVKMPTVVGILTIMSREKILAQQS